jgi:hypothetical protein
MTTENEGFDAGKFFDDGMADAGLESEGAPVDENSQEAGSSDSITVKPDDKGTTDDKEQAETKTADKAEEKAADSSASAEDIQDALNSTETESEPDSVIAGMLPKAEEVEAAAERTGQPDRTGKFVPVEDHIKLRKRAQSAEQRVSELEGQIADTSTGGEKPGEVEKSPLEKFVEENPDEDFVPAKVQLEERKFQERRQLAKQQAERKAEQARTDAAEKQQTRAKTIRAINERALKSEAEFRKVTPDFDAVTKPLVDGNFLSNEERLDFLKNENPAKRLYEICKAKRDALRSVAGEQTATAKDTPKEKPTGKKAPANPEGRTEEDLSDDEIFDEIKDELNLDK